MCSQLPSHTAVMDMVALTGPHSSVSWNTGPLLLLAHLIIFHYDDIPKSTNRCPGLPVTYTVALFA